MSQSDLLRLRQLPTQEAHYRGLFRFQSGIRIGQFFFRASLQRQAWDLSLWTMGPLVGLRIDTNPSRHPKR